MSATMALLKGGNLKSPPAADPKLDEALDQEADASEGSEAGDDNGFVEADIEEVAPEAAVLEDPDTDIGGDDEGGDVEQAQATKIPTTQTEVHKLTSAQVAAVYTAVGIPVDGFEAMSLPDQKKALNKVIFKPTKAQQKKAAANGAGTSVSMGAKTGEVLGPDPLLTFSQEVEAMTEQSDVEERILRVQEQEGLSDFMLGGLFAKLKDIGDFGEFKNFPDYISAKFGVAYRKAQYQIKIYEGLLNSGVPYEKVKVVGWTKLKELVDVLTVENADEWIAKALSMNTDTLIKTIAAEVNGSAEDVVGSAPAETASEVKSMQFKLHADQLETVEAALEKAMKAGQTDVKSVALEYICAEYLATSSTKKPPAPKEVKVFPEPQDYLAHLAEKYGEDKSGLVTDLLEGSGFLEMFPNLTISGEV